MTFYEEYKKYRLSRPIIIKASWLMQILVWGGGTCLIVGCLFALGSLDFKIMIVAGFGLLFFSLALIFIGSALFRGRSKGLIQFSQEGLWLSSLGIILPWGAIGPAWVNTTEHAGRKTDEVLFIVHGIDQYTKNIDFLANFHLKLIKRSLDLGKGGALDFCLGVLFYSQEEGEILEDLIEKIECIRAEAASDSSAVLLNIPAPFHIGIAPHELVAVLNTELCRKLYTEEGNNI